MRFIVFLLSFLVCAAAQAAAHPHTLLVYGDSISAAYGLDPRQGWVQLLQQRLDKSGYEFQVVNASVSGETSTGGLARLPRALEAHRPEIVIFELGANDGLRGLPLTVTRENLRRMIGLARAAHARVLLAGMRMPPNYGERYANDFQQLYPRLAASEKVALIPFLMDKVALVPRLMQADGLHPNAAGQPGLLDNVWRALLPLLQNEAKHGGRQR